MSNSPAQPTADNPQAQYGLEAEGNRGVHPWRQRVPYKAFKSQYGPEYAAVTSMH